MKLFEGDDDDVEKLSKIEINNEFARRFEHNKKREDLQRFEELRKKGLVDEDDSSDESEDDDDDEDFGKPISEKDAQGARGAEEGVKERGDEDVEDDDDAEEFSKKLDEYFGEDDKLDENDRFEENAGDRVWGHSRKVEGSVRKKTNARKLQRERKEERMAKEEDERKEELKRLKNLKKKEMREKLQKIKETAGIGDDGVCLLDEDDLEEEFNPEEYDKKMKKAFGEAYYEAEDVNPDFGSDEDADEGDLEKPDFDKEDELLGLPKGWDEMNQPREGFLSIRERILKSQENTGEEHETVDEEDGVSEEGDLKTRFKYKPVNAKRFGLSTEEMLMLDDKELNQYVPLKTLAPYRDKDWKVPRAKRHQQKQKIKELIQGKTLDIRKNEKKRPRDQETTIVANYTENERPHLEGSNGDTSTLSRKKRRKMRLAELKTSHRRLLAFGFNKKK
nr:protein KRI1 homolog [Ipomoea batatas]